MSKKMIGFLLFAAGDVLLIVGLAADSLGLGAVPGVIGWKQMAMAGVGLVVQIVGLVMTQMQSTK